MRVYLSPPLIDRHLVRRRTGNRLLEAEGVEDALVEDLFGEPTVPHLLVVVLEALPVGTEGV